MIPYSLVHNDVRFSRQGITTGNDYFDYIKNAVQCVIDEDPPRMLSFGLHNRIIAHPGRAFGLAKALDWLTNRPQGVARAACRHSGALAQMAPATARGLTYCSQSVPDGEGEYLDFSSSPSANQTPLRPKASVSTRRARY